MFQVVWEAGEYGYGTDRGVLYLDGFGGIAWNGLVSVTDSQNGSTNVIHRDGVAYGFDQQDGVPTVIVEAFTYPREFEDFCGDSAILTGQPRRPFGLSWREMQNEGYRIHIVYNAIAEPIQVKHQTIGTLPDPVDFAWKLSSVPKIFPGGKPTAHFIIDSNLTLPNAVDQLEDILYGTPLSPPRLPDVEEIMDILEGSAILKITNHGDGTWSAEGPDSVVYFIDETTFEINWPSVVYITDDLYDVSTL